MERISAVSSSFSPTLPSVPERAHDYFGTGEQSGSCLHRLAGSCDEVADPLAEDFGLAVHLLDITL
jgi:hypothetical protein